MNRSLSGVTIARSAVIRSPSTCGTITVIRTPFACATSAGAPLALPDVNPHGVARLAEQARDQPAGAVAPVDGVAGGARLATAVRPRHDVGREQLFQPRQVTVAGGGDEAFRELVRGAIVGVEPRPRFLEALRRPVVQLARADQRTVEDIGDRGVVVAEGLTQHERRSLGRRELFQQHQHGQGYRFALLDVVQRAERVVLSAHRFRQPRPDVLLAPHARGRRWLRQRFVTTLVSHAPGAATSSACDQRRYASWTMSSASAADPSMR